MASIPIAWNNVSPIAQQRLKVNVLAVNYSVSRKQETLFCKLPKNGSCSVSSSVLFSYGTRKAPIRFLCSSADEKIDKKKTIEPPQRKFSLQLRRRIRSLSQRFKWVSIESLLDRIGSFHSRNAKKITVSVGVSIVLGLFFWFLRVTSMPVPKGVPYTHLIENLQNKSVACVMFEEGTSQIYYCTKSWVREKALAEDDKSGLDGEKDVVVGEDYMLQKLVNSKNQRIGWEYSTRKIDHDVGYLLGLARETGALYGLVRRSVLKSMRDVLVTTLMLWVPLSPLMWIMYRQFAPGNGLAKKRKSSNRLVSFEDVEGVDSAKVELMEVVNCLHGAINYSKLGAKLPRGVLLVGPPGTGKTLLARAVAGEAGVPFFPVSASEFVELFVGRGAARIRDLFNVARKNAPSIVFIDELDAVGGKRGRSFNDERDQTLNQLLTEMDGFESDINVVVIAATNRPEALDPALCRPGRFSRKVYVGEPDEDGRKRILGIHLRGVPLEEDTGLICSLVASLTQGLVGADLANIVNEAVLLAARRGAEIVSREDFMEAVERAKFGINERQTALGKKLGKLFPWMMPSLNGGTQSPPGYQTLS
ncbi:cell division protein ftsH- putative [Striga hermonthica]|uniref:ATP-dependent zinc metalloprotease FTSH, chloroplastic n=1 Tax=Striga hermonthica TaxID=68872 RepID=A0A9N7RGB3_STRHE|nr:cell division protein ftsH- putative [Striga hermonthica]